MKFIKLALLLLTVSVFLTACTSYQANKSVNMVFDTEIEVSPMPNDDIIDLALKSEPPAETDVPKNKEAASGEINTPPPYLPPLSPETDLKLREDFAVYMTDIWPDITVDDVYVKGYYGTYDGCEAVVMYGTDMPMTDNIQEIEIAGCTIWLQSGSFELLLHKDSGFVDIKDAYAQAYLGEDDIFNIAAYVNLLS